MAQALMGAIRTVPGDRYVHSIHGYFLRPGNPKTPAIIRVERLRDGGSFSTRRVIVQQEGRPIFTLDASFQVEEESFNHQFEIPEELEPPAPEKIPEYLLKEPFLSWRHEFRRLQSNSPQPPEQYVWIKANEFRQIGLCKPAYWSLNRTTYCWEPVDCPTEVVMNAIICKWRV